MYKCIVGTYSRIWINRVRLSILLVVSLSPFAPESLAPSRVSLLIFNTQAESGAVDTCDTERIGGMNADEAKHYC